MPFPTLLRLVAAIAGVVVVAACADRPTEPTHILAPAAARSSDGTAALVRQLAAARGIVAMPRPPRVSPALSQLGQALFFDKELSGNRDIACSTCHLPAYATGDAKSLSIGAGGSGLGALRLTVPRGVFIPRNAPPIFNLVAMNRLFWDGRVQRMPDGHVATPAGSAVTPAMQSTLAYGPASALAMFPVTSRTEMRGFDGNELAAIADDDFTGIWAGLMRRLGAIPEYRKMFEDAYPGTPFGQMTFAHASNAIGGFLVDRLTLANSPWDRFLAGDDRALTDAQLEGAKTFLSLKCSICHTGATLSDNDFHDVALAQFGPGAGDGESGRDDFGRMRVTGLPADQYRFRTTPLRNVELTGPWGHAGEFTSLRDFIAHYSESDVALMSYDMTAIEPALQGTLLDNRSAVLAQRDTLLTGVVLSPEIVDRLVAYMSALTDPAAKKLGGLTPQKVPSGLPVDRP